jgi:prepilin-type N-terminal cleavage/methylation domain-containing protein/prepilin-type processing-associated H-X9-DG protein
VNIDAEHRIRSGNGKGPGIGREGNMRTDRKAFTLVELLVVIGIIAVLVGLLLPALAKARDSANAVKCASNLRGIGQAIAQYVTENQNTFPPSNFPTGLNIAGGQITDWPPVLGYTHWSALVNGSAWKAATDYLLNSNGNPLATAPQLSPFENTANWGQFQCPSLDNGGLPPANTYTGNNELGVANESNIPNIVDLQAPRLAYTLNEALCPRSLIAYVPAIANLHNYRFVRAGQIQHSADTILATELWGFQLAAEANSYINSGTLVSNTRRPVSGFINITVSSPDQLYNSINLSNIMPITQPFLNYIGRDPSTTLAAGTTPQSSLAYVGRNHGGGKKFGAVAGATTTGWDLRQTNFLYVDGHVETKNIVDTVYPKFQWGDSFYSLPN